MPHKLTRVCGWAWLQEVGTEEIAQVVSKWTGVPVSRLQQTEREKLLHLKQVRPGHLAQQCALETGETWAPGTPTCTSDR